MKTSLELDAGPAIWREARLARDARFDGRFFVGVRTTGIYCRPVCRVKMPREENVTYFPTAAAAGEAGFRPCLRCRPEAAPGSPAWLGTSTTVRRALDLILTGALDEGTVTDLAARLGITARYLNRLFAVELGVSPLAVAQTRRLQQAKRLLDSTSLGLADIAYAAGYGSVRRFNDHFRKTYGTPPSTLRKQQRGGDEDTFEMALGYRPPFDFPALLGFLAGRAIPGVEQVSAETYRRVFRLSGEIAWVTVTDQPAAHSLRVRTNASSARVLLEVMTRVRHLFDLEADPLEINRVLGRDPALAPLVADNPGRRVPGCWAPFEVAVRAVVGQQVSVKGATTIMGRLVASAGEPCGDLRLFPAPEAIAALVPDDLPMPRARGEALRQLGAAVAAGAVDFTLAPDEVEAQLCAIKGIGPWTAQYVAMRALRNPDAFLARDLVLMRVASALLGTDTDKALMARAEAWRPWRAYAALHLWARA